MLDILKLIRERRSSRIPFDLERPVAKEDLEKILEAARWSPTAHNMQNFEIIVVDDKEILKAIGNLKRADPRNFHPGKLSAPILFRRGTVEEKDRAFRDHVSAFLEKPGFQT